MPLRGPGWGRVNMRSSCALPSRGVSGSFRGCGLEGVGPPAPPTTAVGSPFSLFPTKQPGPRVPVNFCDGGPEVKFSHPSPTQGAGGGRPGPSLQGSQGTGPRFHWGEGSVFGRPQCRPHSGHDDFGGNKMTVSAPETSALLRRLEVGVPSPGDGWPPRLGVDAGAGEPGRGSPRNQTWLLRRGPMLPSLPPPPPGDCCLQGLGFPARGSENVATWSLPRGGGLTSCKGSPVVSDMPKAICQLPPGSRGPWGLGPGRSKVDHLGSTGGRKNGRKGRKKGVRKERGNNRWRERGGEKIKRDERRDGREGALSYLLTLQRPLGVPGLRGPQVCEPI